MHYFFAKKMALNYLIVIVRLGDIVDLKKSQLFINGMVS